MLPGIMSRPLRKIYVHTSVEDASRGWLRVGSLLLPCALGRSGTTTRKREGDGATPLGAHALRRVWWRPDHGPRPQTFLPVRRTRPDDLWCDQSGDRDYNRPVKAPFAASHEEMWRGDTLYDFVVELGWNDDPPRAGRGSAIFMHVARPGFRPTEGCVALRRADLARLLPRLGPHTRIVVR
jgi:L,D-peptidoglycan transpeptidase YkuD (ErfK/YbiS/YcfS/YnhG family)